MGELRGKSARSTCELCGYGTLGRRFCIRCEINRADEIETLLQSSREVADDIEVDDAT
jgi:hypothetical protein